MKAINFYHQHDGITEELLAPYVEHLENGFHRFSVSTNEMHTTSCIEVKDTTIVKWMYRGDREYLSPIAVNEIPQKTSTLSIICIVDDDGNIKTEGFFCKIKLSKLKEVSFLLLTNTSCKSHILSILKSLISFGIEVITIEAVANLSSHTAKVLYFQRYMQPILIPSVPIHIHFLTF